MTHRTHTACLPRLSYCSTVEVRIATPYKLLIYNNLYTASSARRMQPLCICTKVCVSD